MKNQSETIKKQAQELLSLVKNGFLRTEKWIRSEKNQKKIRSEFEKAKNNLALLKKKCMQYEEKATRYTEKNPKKAMAIAGAAGILAATFWKSFRKKS